MRRIADEEGFNLVGWTVDSGDWLDDISHGSRDYNRAAPAVRCAEWIN